MQIDDPNAGAGQFSQLFILRTFSTVKPGMMARFMNALTWQAAWLRHFYEWDRGVVGYALTGVPERVLEVYGVPEPHQATVEATLKRLHQQEEYRELLQCCEAEQRAEELLPAMGYKTLLGEYELGRMKELEEYHQQLADFAARRLKSEQELKGYKDQLDELQVREENLRFTVASLLASIQKLEAEIAGAKDGTSGAANNRQEASTSPGSLQEELDREREKLGKTQQSLAGIPAQRDSLEEQQRQVQERMEQIDTDSQTAQLQVVSKSRFPGRPFPAYFLNVTIKVMTDKLDEYIQRMRALLEDFKWDFIAAGQNIPKPTVMSGGGNLEEHEIMHLWKFGDANDLYQQMVELRENPRFSEIEKLTTRESQMLMCDWEALSKTKRLPQLETHS